MSPEYRVIVPQQIADEFEKAIRLIPGALIIPENNSDGGLADRTRTIISKRSTQKDYPAPRESFALDELAQSVKSTLEQIPSETRLRDLTFWNFPPYYKEEYNIPTPSEWSSFMLQLKARDRAFITRSIRLLTRTISPRELEATIDDARNLDLQKAPYPPGIGSVTKEFFTKVFSK